MPHHRCIHLLLLIPALAGLRAPVHAQYRKETVYLRNGLELRAHGPVLLMTEGRPELGGWELPDARVEDGHLLGTARMLHPQSVFDLTWRSSTLLDFCANDTCDLLYGLPGHFVLVYIPAGSVAATPQLRLPLHLVQGSYYCRAKLPMKHVSAYTPDTTTP